jgi:hypothetical protein
VLSYSVGTQIAMAAWSIVLGFIALLLVFRTTDWRALVRQASDEREEEAAERVAASGSIERGAAQLDQPG